jgi:hypothetical protein
MLLNHTYVGFKPKQAWDLIAFHECDRVLKVVHRAPIFRHEDLKHFRVRVRVRVRVRSMVIVSSAPYLYT